MYTGLLTFDFQPLTPFIEIIRSRLISLWQFNIAMTKSPFIDPLALESQDLL